MKLVLDTNVLLSAYLWGGQVQFIRDMISQPDMELYSSAHLLGELSDVLSRERFSEKLSRTSQTVESIVTQVKTRFQIVSPEEIPTICRDPDDNHVLACAETAQANYIVTGDKDLLVLEKYQTIEIVTPWQLAQILNPED